MSQLAKFPLKNGGFLAVEVDAVDSPGSRVMRGSPSADVLAEASDSFEAALEKVRSAAEPSSINSLTGTAADEVAVEFGVKMSAERERSSPRPRARPTSRSTSCGRKLQQESKP